MGVSKTDYRPQTSKNADFENVVYLLIKKHRTFILNEEKKLKELITIIGTGSNLLTRNSDH